MSWAHHPCNYYITRQGHSKHHVFLTIGSPGDWWLPSIGRLGIHYRNLQHFRVKNTPVGRIAMSSFFFGSWISKYNYHWPTIGPYHATNAHKELRRGPSATAFACQQSIPQHVHGQEWMETLNIDSINKWLIFTCYDNDVICIFPCFMQAWMAGKIKIHCTCNSYIGIFFHSQTVYVICDPWWNSILFYDSSY